MDNIVTKKLNYHLYVNNKLNALWLLEFRKVNRKERLEAEKPFASKDTEEEARKEPFFNNFIRDFFFQHQHHSPFNAYHNMS